MTFTPISSCTTCFLIITLNTFRNVVVNNKTNIRFIDSHTKGNGRYYDVAIIFQKLILM